MVTSLSRPAALALLLVVVLGSLTATARAEPDPPAQPWSAAYPQVRADLEAGRPLVVEVLVPLCSNEQIWCGATWAGLPDVPRTNIYWGAIFGARTLFGRKGSGWDLVEVVAVDDVVLERAVFRRTLRPGPWGLEAEATRDQYVVLEAIHGAHIGRAVADLYTRAARGSTVSFEEAGQARTLRVHAIGYAGHNRLMDGIAFPPALPAAAPGDAPVPAFVLACISEKYFSPALREVGAAPLVMTRTYMAPEGYLIEAIARGLGENDTAPALRERAVASYAKWQRLSRAQAGAVFAPR